MQKISYINQMNNFMARCSEDALPANAVVMYLMLFNCFNRAYWRNTWMRFTIQQLMAFTHVGSPNTVYNMRRLLKELGYIDYHSVKNGRRSHVEYRLIPLGISSSNGSNLAAGIMKDRTDMAANMEVDTTVNTAADMAAGIAVDTAEYMAVDMAADMAADVTAGCAFADIPCGNRECSANERPDNAYANFQPALSEYANNEPSNFEVPVSECSKSEGSNSEFSVSERSKSEYSNSECSKNECSLTENSINAPAKSENSKSESLNSEYSISESSCRQYAGECSGECSKSERQTDNSPNREEKEKKIYTSHDTSQKYEGEVNNNINNNNNSSDNKKPMSVSEFLRTNGDYLLCVDAYKDYFHHEPPAGDKVLILRFLADYGVNSTLSAMDVMIQNKADSLSCCETILRQSQWKINRKAIRRPTLSKEWAGWQMA